MSLTSIVAQELKLKSDQDKWSELSSNTPVQNSLFATALAEKIKNKEKESAEATAEHAIELLSKSQSERDFLIDEARNLRQRAKSLVAKAEELYNAEQHLILKGKIAPLAIQLGVVSVVSSVKEELLNPIPNYFKQQKKEKSVSDVE